MFFQFLQQYPFILAFILGLLPALVWLWFWLKEDTHPEPAKMITLSFLGGMFAVIIVLPLQKIVYYYFTGEQTLSFLLWAAVEEICKFIVVYFIALRNKATDEPVDYIIYLIVGALGFVTFENTLFLLQPIGNGDIAATILNSNMRFVGASLLHTISSATIGVCMALSCYKDRVSKREALLVGLILATILHTSFNLFIINQVEGNIFLTFGMVWIGIIAILLLFEKVKSINIENS